MYIVSYGCLQRIRHKVVLHSRVDLHYVSSLAAYIHVVDHDIIQLRRGLSHSVRVTPAI